VIELVSIYPQEGEPPSETLDFLYDLLAERDETTNISHISMPGRPTHVDFVLGRPYKDWWLLVDDGVRVGAMYLSKANEVGLFLLRRYRGKGRGPRAVVRLQQRSNAPLFANINPRNYPSIGMFEMLNFTHIQNTYKWTPPSN